MRAMRSEADLIGLARLLQLALASMHKAPDEILIELRRWSGPTGLLSEWYSADQLAIIRAEIERLGDDV